MTLTVKHIDSNGAEQIMSCGSFFVERNRSDRTATFCAYKGNHRGTELLNLWSGEISPEPMHNTAVFYIVNEHGSTVAIHRYNDEAYTSLSSRLEVEDPHDQLILPLDRHPEEG